MLFTTDQLKQIIGRNPYLDYWHDAICTVCEDYEIDTPTRMAAFLSQCAHESANFTRIRENLNYRAETLMKTWPKRFPTIDVANQYAHNPEKLANFVYSNRLGNGPAESGDGFKYIGRGLIQLTGKENYEWFAKSVGMELKDVPGYLQTFEGAVQSACFFWETNSLNTYADKQDIDTLTKKINGGTLGLKERKALFELAKKVLR